MIFRFMKNPSLLSVVISFQCFASPISIDTSARGRSSCSMSLLPLRKNKNLPCKQKVIT